MDRLRQVFAPRSRRGPEPSAARVVAIGHSHVKAVLDALPLPLDPARFDVVSFWVEPGAVVREGERARYSRAVERRIAGGGRVFSCIGGSAHTVLGLAAHPRPFDFVLPSRPELPVDPLREPVPADGVRAALAAIAGEFFGLMDALARVARAPVVQLAPPPPLADAERIAPHVPWEYFPGRQQVIAPRWLRYKLWRMHCEMIEAESARLGWGFAWQPAAALDPDGFLRPELDGDGLHAGPGYGRLVLDAAGVAL